MVAPQPTQQRKSKLFITLAIIGGIVLAVLLIVLLLRATIFRQPHIAKQTAQPFAAQLQQANATLLCESDNELSEDNYALRRYSAYYQIPDSPNLVSDVQSLAQKSGFSVKQVTADEFGRLEQPGTYYLQDDIMQLSVYQPDGIPHEFDQDNFDNPRDKNAPYRVICDNDSRGNITAGAAVIKLYVTVDLDK